MLTRTKDPGAPPQDCTFSAIYRMLRTTRHSFLWLGEDVEFPKPPGATCAVQFTFQCDEDLRILALAFMLIHFREHFALDVNREFPQLLDICYEFTASGGFGVLWYDDPFRATILQVEHQCVEAIRAPVHTPRFFTFHGDLPCSTWNAPVDDFGVPSFRIHVEHFFSLAR